MDRRDFFAFVALRPAAEEVLESQHRLILWRATYRYFFRFVWVFVVVLLVPAITDYFLGSEGSLIPHLICT